jgi:hypothetical protein
MEAAGGFVRCGACMKVFKAHKHILDPSELPTVAEISSIAEHSPPATASKQPWNEELTNDLNSIYQNLAAEFSKQQFVNPNESEQTAHSFGVADLNISSMSQASTALTGPIKNPPSPPPTTKKSRLPKFTDDFSNSFKSLPKSKNETQHLKKSVVIDEIDESWAEKMLGELDEFKEVLTNNSASSPQTTKTQISNAPLPNPQHDKNIPQKPSLLRPQESKTSDDGLLNAALANNLIKELTTLPQKDEPVTPISTPPDRAQLQSDAHSSNEPSKKESPPAQTSRSNAHQVGDRQLNLVSIEADIAEFPPTSKEHHLTNITTANSEDEDVFYKQDRHHQTSSIGYAFGCLLLTVILICLHGFYNFNTLNQVETIRPFYVMACELLDCVVPPRQNINQIVNLNVVVQQHPTISQALRANVLIRNQADYPQPFPQLKLTFTDLQQQIIAERVFLPSEYQKSELSNLTMMPSQQSIRLMFDFWDPGQAAVSSELSICQIQNKVLRCKT